MTAIVYTGDEGLFTHIGVVIRSINEMPDDISVWDERQAEIQDVFELGEQQDAEASLIGICSGMQNTLASVRNSLSTICDARLQDYDSVIAILGIPTNSVQSVLNSLIYKMISDSATVNRSTVTVGTVTAAGTNVGNGTILVDKVLDGYNSPINGATSHPAYYNVDSEFSVVDTISFVCNKDSYTDRSTSGQEAFSQFGTVALTDKWSVGTEGAGQGPSIGTTAAGTILRNMDFETFTTTNTPDNWTIAAGVVTTNVQQSTSGGNYYRGISAVKLIGTGVAAITLTQAISSSSVNPLRRYCCTVRYKASATDLVGVVFTVRLTGTGYTEGSTEKISIVGTSLQTSWTLANFFVNIPSVVPSDLKLQISLSGTPAINLFVDSLGFAPVTYFNGVCAIAVPGSTDFVRNDTFTVSIDNDNSGSFSNFFRRNYSIQLPSAASGTISDGLAY